MRNGNYKEGLPPTLDNLINDGRLARLFSTEANHCALQLWVLQIKSEQSIENRVVYGRMLPYSYSNDSWSASDDDHFRPFGQLQAQVARLNLYVSSVHCAELLRQLTAGRTVSEVSEVLKLGMSDQLVSRFGSTALAVDNLSYRPVAYLLNRDAHDRLELSSPHGGAGAYSASISRLDKGALFCIDQDYDFALTASVVNQINADTGLDFGHIDSARFGDLELLVFPTLDDQERSLLSASWDETSDAFIVRFNPMRVPHFTGFQFGLSITNNNQTVYSVIGTAERNRDGEFQCKFDLDDQLRTRTDSAEVEVFGVYGDHSAQGRLCCRWRGGYIREIYLQGHVVGHKTSPVKFDWLEKTAPLSESARVKAALAINRGDLGFANHIGGRAADPWVSANRDLSSLFARLHPAKSEGRFFLRRGQGDGEGRLQFVEWFRSLLAQYKQHQMVIFDPYFEDAGLGLLLLCVAPDSDYIVFTSLPKPAVEGSPMRRKSDGSGQKRINNLLANCEQNLHLLKHIRLRICGLKEGRLHDRYILIMGMDGLPAAGFNLSNSFQKVAENYPLLVTPIPSDTLLQVEKYKSALVQEANSAQSEVKTANSRIRILFSSTSPPPAPRQYEPLSFLDKVEAGDVLYIWTGEPALRSLSGDPLKARMATLELLKDGSLVLPESAGLLNCLNRQAGDFSSFCATWNVLGEVLAHSRFGDCRFSELESERDFLDFLARFLEASFGRKLDEVDEELAVLDAQVFQKPVESLLNSSYHPHHLFHPTKYRALTWSEYFAVRFLWWYAPDALLAIAEIQMSSVPIEPQIQDAMRLSLLSQIVSDISLSVQFDLNEKQRDCLIRSRNGLLRWMGLSAIEMQLDKTGDLTVAVQLVNSFSHLERIRTLGWLARHAVGNPKKLESYKGLVAAMHKELPATVSADELGHLVDSMRGHMQELAWSEPWLFEDVLSPLLQDDRIKVDDACKIWMHELTSMLEPQLKGQSLLFNRAREGQTTNVASFLFASSSQTQQKTCLNSLQVILKRQSRVIHQPLASTSDWTRWDRALTVSLWILAFSKWSEYYLRQQSNSGLECLSKNAQEMAMVRPMTEWRSEFAGKSNELVAFLEQAMEMLDSDDASTGQI